MAPATADWSARQIKARVIEMGLTLKGISVAADLDPTQHFREELIRLVKDTIQVDHGADTVEP